MKRNMFAFILCVAALASWVCVSASAVETQAALETPLSEETQPAGGTELAEAGWAPSWNEVTFGACATDLSNCVVGGPADQGLDYTELNGTATVVTDGAGSYTTQYTGAGNQPVTCHLDGLTGDLSTDPEGRVLLSSRDGAGKIQEDEGSDGMLFYYTSVPAGMNYTLRADVEVLRWANNNTQNGVGLAALDRVPARSWTGDTSGNQVNYWNNSYLVGAARTAFSYDRRNAVAYSNKDDGYDAYTKYSYYMGLTSVAKSGIPANADGTAYSGLSNPEHYYERRFPLDIRIPMDGRFCKVGNNYNCFNLIGNYSAKPAGFSAMHENGGFMANYELTKFTVQLQKNNTGYITTVWDESGNQLGQNIEYFVKGAMDLSGDKAYHDDDVTGRKDIPELQCLDKDFEYVGLFTACEMDALFTNVVLATIPAGEDAPAIDYPTTLIVPAMNLASGSYSNSPSFNLSVSTNVEGTVTVEQNGVTLPETYAIKYNAQGLTDRLDIPVTLEAGRNSFKVTFQPDPDQKLAPFTELVHAYPIAESYTVTHITDFSKLQNIYVSPKGRPTNFGTKASPVDVHTAVSAAQPGQNIVLLEGVYDLSRSIRIDRDMDGTREKPIYFTADVDETGKPVKVVLNGGRKAGSVIVHAADWWIFKDFEVVGSGNSSPAFQLSGSHNIVQNVDAHDNGGTGLSIGRLAASDRGPVRDPAHPEDVAYVTDWGDWPCFNTVINCDSYRNYDQGYSDADGFAAKLTAGAGNVFDGCAAYWNADDGWDLFAKSDPGPIGTVEIRNCVAFQNGYEVRKIIDPTTQECEMEADGYTAVMDLDAEDKIVLTEAGKGIGFKMGGSNLPGAHRVENSYAFYNMDRGFDSNNGPDIQIVGCTAYNNARENVGLGSKFAALNYLVEKTVSFKDENAPVDWISNIAQMEDAIPYSEGVDATVYDQNNFFTWTDAKKSVNMAGTAEITKDNFASLEFDNTLWINGAPRNADGTLQLGDFLKLTGVTGTGAGELVNAPGSSPVETPDAVLDPPQEGPAGSAVTGVTLDETDVALTVGETVTLTATVLPADAVDKSVTWSSSNDAVATVRDGVVTAVSGGEAAITVTTVDGGYTEFCVVTVSVPVSDVSTPRLSVASVVGGKTVALTCATDGAVIHYTLNGSTPTAASAVYTEPILLTATTTVKAVAIKDGTEGSKTFTGTFTVDTVAPPSASHPGGEVEPGSIVTLASATGGATIYYTTDGTDPSSSATRMKYTGSVPIVKSMTLRAVAQKLGCRTSLPTEVAYTVPEQPTGSLSVSLGSATAAPGDLVSVPVYFFTDAAVTSFSFDIVYDTDVFVYQSATSNVYVRTDPVDHKITVLSAQAPESSEACTLDFLIRASAANADYTLAMENVSVTASEPVACGDVTHATVSVAGSYNSNITADVIQASNDSGGVTTQVKFENAAADAEHVPPIGVILAAYDRQGRMIACDVKEVSMAEISAVFTHTMEIPEGVEVGSIRLFLVSDLQTLKPLCPAGSVL